MVEALICNQEVIGSTPITSFLTKDDLFCQNYTGLLSMLNQGLKNLFSLSEKRLKIEELLQNIVNTCEYYGLESIDANLYQLFKRELEVKLHFLKNEEFRILNEFVAANKLPGIGSYVAIKNSGSGRKGYSIGKIKEYYTSDLYILEYEVRFKDVDHFPEGEFAQFIYKCVSYYELYSPKDILKYKIPLCHEGNEVPPFSEEEFLKVYNLDIPEDEFCLYKYKESK